MLHACVQRFDVIENLKNFWKLNKAISLFLMCTHRNANLQSARRHRPPSQPTVIAAVKEGTGRVPPCTHMPTPCARVDKEDGVG
jgi:hypothetical protein